MIIVTGKSTFVLINDLSRGNRKRVTDFVINVNIKTDKKATAVTALLLQFLNKMTSSKKLIGGWLRQDHIPDLYQPLCFLQ